LSYRGILILFNPYNLFLLEAIGIIYHDFQKSIFFN